MSDNVIVRDRTIADIRNCGCWIIYLAQGCIILPCDRHEPTMLAAINDDITALDTDGVRRTP